MLLTEISNWAFDEIVLAIHFVFSTLYSSWLENREKWFSYYVNEIRIQ